MKHGPAVRAAVFAITLTCLLAVPGKAAAARVEGRVVGPAGMTPVAGATVTFSSLTSRETFQTPETAEDGAYRLPTLPAGTFDVAIRTDRGLWLAAEPLRLEADDLRTVSFALREVAPDRRPGPEGASPTPPQVAEEVVGVAVVLEDTMDATAPAGGSRRRLWTGVGIGAGILALAILAGDDSSGSEASPFQP